MRYELNPLTAVVGMDEQMERLNAQRHQRARGKRTTSAPLFEPLLLSGFS